MVLQAKRVWSLLLAFVLACTLSIPAQAFALDGQGDTSDDSDGSVAVYVRDTAGNEEMLKSYTAEEFAALATVVDAGYQYGDANLLAVHELVEFDTLLSDAGAGMYWTKGASLEFTCTDGVYGKFVPTYELLHSDGYFYPNRSANDTGNTEGAVTVPAGIAPSGQFASAKGTTGIASDELAALLETIAAGEGDTGTKVGVGIIDGDDAPGNAGWRLVGNAIKITVLAPENVELGVALKVAVNGEVAKSYSADEISALMNHTDYQYYIQSNHGSVQGIAVKDYVAIDDVIADAGLAKYWVSGSSLQYICSDGVYGKNVPTYDELHTQIYTYPNQSLSDMKNMTGAFEVPAVLAFTAGKVNAGEGLASDAYTAAKDQMKTYPTLAVYRGWAPDSDGAIEAPGWRLPNGVLEINIIPAASVEFSDIESGAWYEAAVSSMVNEGIIKGYDNGTFGPMDSMTRAQLATILWRYAEPEEAAAYVASTATNATGMADVESGKFYTGAANWAVENGVINGVEASDGTRSFNPEATVTFEQMVTIVANMAGGDAVASADPAVLNSFSDAASVSSWASQSLAWAVSAGLVNGYDNGTLAPDEGVYRARGTAIIYNGFEVSIF